MEPSNRVTLKRLARVATFLYRIRAALFVIGLAAVIWFLVVLSDESTASTLALAPLSVLVWSALLLGCGYTMTLPPPGISQQDSFGSRVRKRLLQGSYGVGLIVLLVLLGFALFLSYRALQMLI